MLTPSRGDFSIVKVHNNKRLATILYMNYDHNRYQYDPNMNIRKAMTSIWTALVPDGKKTVDKYTQEIMKELLANITSNVWRIRESW